MEENPFQLFIRIFFFEEINFTIINCWGSFVNSIGIHVLCGSSATIATSTMFSVVFFLPRWYTWPTGLHTANERYINVIEIFFRSLSFLCFKWIQAKWVSLTFGTHIHENTAKDRDAGKCNLWKIDQISIFSSKNPRFIEFYSVFSLRALVRFSPIQSHVHVLITTQKFDSPYLLSLNHTHAHALTERLFQLESSKLHN